MAGRRWVLLVLLILACSGKPTGTEGGACYGNDTCNRGLVCLSHFCVRLIDAGMPDAGLPDASLPDAPIPDAPFIDAGPPVASEYLLSLLLPGTSTPIQFVAENAYTPFASAGTLRMTLVPLDASTRMRIAGSDIVLAASTDTGASKDIAVTSAGSFTAGTDDAQVPGAANAIIPGANAEFKPIELDALDYGPNRFCGTAKGMIVKPIPQDIAGSTFGAELIAIGSEGSALPPPVVSCPEVLDGGIAPDATSCTLTDGTMGTCIDVSQCTGTSTAGFCSGAASTQCCTH